METIIEQLQAILGPQAVFWGETLVERGVVHPVVAQHPTAPKALIRPRTTEEVSAVLRACHAVGQPVVPVGGRTGLVQGTRARRGEVLLSLERFVDILDVDPADRAMTVEAGVPLQAVQERAEAEGLLFPLDLGARGSATVGGTISTNAGGNRVIRYGMMRDMVLGLEAVMADGTVVSALNRMIKNNAGYDVKQLFIGTEGTLGIVTRAVLRLRPKPASQDTAFVAVASFEQLVAFLRAIDGALGGALSAFEVMWEDFYRLVTRPPARNRPPLADGHPYYVLVETLGADPAGDTARFEAALGALLEQGLIADAVVAKSQAERDAMWAMRDDVGQVSQFGPFFVYDVSLPLRAMPAYVETVRRVLAERFPGARSTVFGHLGDGNLHLVVGAGGADEATRHGVEAVIYEPLAAVGGSISAEHGIGLEKRPYLPISRSPAEIALMATLKRALDPKAILNPGKVLAVDQAGL